MFRSKRRPIIIPQSEHARFSGALACFWGNGDFARPNLPFDSFVKGVTLHDRGYGLFDTIPIGSVDEPRWLEVKRLSLEQRFDDEVANIVIAFHVLRLVGHTLTPPRKEFVKTHEQAVRERMKQVGVSAAEFEHADTITSFCDSVSYDFCFEQKKRGVVHVAGARGSRETVPISYELDENGSVTVSPWPFSVRSIESFVLGYDAHQYPARQEPIVIQYSVHP